ncbi:hypothetical protein [Helicobacter pylori]|uniref:hypothetical protein n=1 Tax=Helicobacter pylori TaxID=210 RepID=UPI0002BBB8CD|nr:hypothetical protein [Helicobacter pylori]EMH08667.1 hypothetical protein HMPREF1409_00945 [Helicobacter pylori GAM246Ai]EMH35447.1 hypothetical protein HMPREF1426_00662 [Helicobacter pylori GAM80Ai]PDW66029.1 hypothetical protein BB447_07870 [Helicobacter pylori]RKV02534.1 hypothetical protein DDP44_08335 [Helicobacter pylori]RKV12720.1 hypothetical protein DDP48_01955 [Helicobacter pylori]
MIGDDVKKTNENIGESKNDQVVKRSRQYAKNKKSYEESLKEYNKYVVVQNAEQERYENLVKEFEQLLNKRKAIDNELDAKNREILDSAKKLGHFKKTKKV